MYQPRTYKPANWYWIVAGDETQVYSSAAGHFVPSDDPAYIEWLATQGQRPTRIVSSEELSAVLAARGITNGI